MKIIDLFGCWKTIDSFGCWKTIDSFGCSSTYRLNYSLDLLSEIGVGWIVTHLFFRVKAVSGRNRMKLFDCVAALYID